MSTGIGLVWTVESVGMMLVGVGLLIHNPGVVFWGFLAVAGGLVAALVPNGLLRKEEVVDSWSVLLEDAAGKADVIFTDTREILAATEVPDVSVSVESFAQGMVKAIGSEGREFLVIRHQNSIRLAPYQMFANSRDYGAGLVVDWYVMFRPTLWHALLTLFFVKTIKSNPVLDLDLFDESDLRAYVSNAHRCLLKAVDKVLLGMSKDPGDIERKSRGFLGIS